MESKIYYFENSKNSKYLKYLSSIFLMLFIAQFTYAQPAISEPTFNILDNCSNGSSTGFNNTVNTIALQTDGKILVGGAFTIFNGTSINRIVRLNSDGTLDGTFNIGSGFNNNIMTICVQSDGKIIVGGSFTSFNGITINRIARLNTDGSLDTSFGVGTGFNQVVNTIVVQQNGKILVGGQFTLYNGSTKNRIVRLNPDGTVDTTINFGTGFTDEVKAIAIQADGQIIVGGKATAYNGFGKNRLFRLLTSGQLDNGFNLGTGIGNTVNSIAIQSDGKVIIGGIFSTINGNSVNGIARLSYNNGAVDQSFIIGSGSLNVNSIIIQTDSKILIAGTFYFYNGSSAQRIARLNMNGTIDTYFNTALGFNDEVKALAIQTDGKIIAGGVFSTYKNICRSKIARLNVACANSSSTNTITACNSYTWQNGVTYTQSNNTATHIITNSTGCDSIISLNLTINNTSIPTGSNSQILCSPATIANLTATGTAIKWYSSSTGGSQLANSTALVNGSTYYASQTINGCESQNRLAVTVTINNTAAPTGNATQTFCGSTFISDLVVTGTSIKWYSSQSGGNPLNSNTVAINNMTYYATQTINGCESQSRLAVTVSFTNPNAPSGVMTQSFCGSGLISDLSATGTAIKWFVSVTSDSALSTNTTLLNGETYYASQTINGCESENRLAVQVILKPFPVTTITQTTGTLTADQVDGTYQWLDCNNSLLAIIGQTNQIFSPVASGNYAVRIYLNNCSATSECVDFQLANVIEIDENELVIYPNPNNGHFTLLSPINGTIICLNSLGQKLDSFNVVKDVVTEFNLEKYANGMYYLMTENRKILKVSIMK